MERARKRRSRESLEARVGQWLRAAEQGAHLDLSVDDAKLVQRALRDALRLQNWGRNRDLERGGLSLERSSRAVMQAFGWSPGRRRHYPTYAVVHAYLCALGRDTNYGCSPLVSIGPDGRPVPPAAPMAPVDALRAVAKLFRFPSVLACREFLLRARRQLKAANPEKRFASLVHDFPLPSAAKSLVR